MEDLAASLRSAGLQASYLPNLTFCEYLEKVKVCAPVLYRLLDLASAERIEFLLGQLRNHRTGFESKAKGGRGDAYRAGQKRYPLARKRGVKRLLEILENDRPRAVLDAVGGNGTITRVRGLLASEMPGEAPFIITSDLDAEQVAAALDEGLPAVRQPAQCTLFKSSVFDAVLFAFGTHHIPVPMRAQAWSEARRVLRPGGRVVVHDFEIGTPTETWYSVAMNFGTETGHDYVHFTADSLRGDLMRAGFKDVEISYVYEPFELNGESEQDAIISTVRHLVSLFGLEKLRPRVDTPEEWLRIGVELSGYFMIPESIPLEPGCARQVRVRRQEGGYVAEFPRISLVATGINI